MDSSGFSSNLEKFRSIEAAESLRREREKTRKTATRSNSSLLSARNVAFAVGPTTISPSKAESAHATSSVASKDGSKSNNDDIVNNSNKKGDRLKKQKSGRGTASAALSTTEMKLSAVSKKTSSSRTKHGAKAARKQDKASIAAVATVAPASQTSTSAAGIKDNAKSHSTVGDRSYQVKSNISLDSPSILQEPLSRKNNARKNPREQSPIRSLDEAVMSDGTVETNRTTNGTKRKSRRRSSEHAAVPIVDTASTADGTDMVFDLVPDVDAPQPPVLAEVVAAGTRAERYSDDLQSVAQNKDAESERPSLDALLIFEKKIIFDCVQLIKRRRVLVTEIDDSALRDRDVERGEQLMQHCFAFRDALSAFRESSMLGNLVAVMKSLNRDAAAACDDISKRVGTDDVVLEDHLKSIALALADVVRHVQKLSQSTYALRHQETSSPSITSSLSGAASGAVNLPPARASSTDLTTRAILSGVADSIEHTKNSDILPEAKLLLVTGSGEAAAQSTQIESKSPSAPQKLLEGTDNVGQDSVALLHDEVSTLTEQLVEALSDLKKARSSNVDLSARLASSEDHNRELMHELVACNRRIQSLEDDLAELQQFVLQPQQCISNSDFVVPDFENFAGSALLVPPSTLPTSSPPVQKSVPTASAVMVAKPQATETLSDAEYQQRRLSLDMTAAQAIIQTRDIYYEFQENADTDENIKWSRAPIDSSFSSIKKGIRSSDSSVGRRGSRKVKRDGLPLSCAALVQIVRGRSLALRDSSSLGNPYLVCRIVPSSMTATAAEAEKIRGRKTRTVKKTSNPLWNDSFDLSFSDVKSDALHLSVWDWNLIGNSAPMGKAVVPLTGLEFNSPTNFWVPLEGGNGQINVEILLQKRDAPVASARQILKAATLDKIIELLTPAEKARRDEELIRNWLLTFRAILSPRKFLDLLIERYKGPSDTSRYPDHVKYQRTLKAVQNSVGHVMHLWLSETSDVRLDPGLQGEFRIFLQSCKPPTAYTAQCLAICENDFSAEDPVHFSDGQTFSTPQTMTWPGRAESSSVRPASAASKLLASAVQVRLVNSTLTVHDVSAEDLAEQITLMEFELTKTLARNPHEFVRQAWNKKGAEDMAPNILAYIDWFNNASLWLQTLVMQCEDNQSRAVVIAKIIQMGSRMAELKNFNGVMEVVTALHSSAVSRLSRTWNLLPQEVQDDFDVLSQLLSPESNFKQYRAAFSRAGRTCVPYVGVWLTDLTFIDDANPDTLDTELEPPLLNVEKLFMVASRLCELRRALEVPYSFHKSNKILKAITNSASEVWLESDLFRISLMRQPRSGDASLSAIDDNDDQRFDSKTFAKITADVMSRGVGRNFVDTEATPLTPRDWKLLLTCAELVNRKKDDVIVAQGKRNEYLFRLHRGICRIEKTVDAEDGVAAQTIVLPHKLKPPSMFGEMSVLGDFGIASASVISDDDATVVYQMEMSFIEGLFATEPGLSMRFFNFAAHKLADMLVSMGGGPKKGKQTEEPVRPARKVSSVGRSSSHNTSRTAPSRSMRRGMSTAVTTAIDVAETSESKSRIITADALVQRKFKIAGDDLVLKVYRCGFKKRLLYNGKLYVTQKHLCFSARAFGSKAKIKIAFKDIKQMHNLDSSKIVIQRTSKGKLRFIFESEDEAAVAYKFAQRIWKRRHLRAGADSYSDSEDRALSLQEVEDENKKNDTFSVLPASDWEQLLRGAKSVTVPRNEIIISQGQQYQRLYQISRGRCRIELTKPIPADAPPGTKPELLVLGAMEQGELFGEISFLRGVGASATVVADSETVDLTIIEGYFVNALFNMEPEFAGRFYKYLAALLAYRIRLRGK